MGQKVIMAVTGFIPLGFVVVHMIGNLMFTGAEHINAYAGFLRTVGEPVLPHKTLLWIVLLLSVGLHIWAAVELTRRDYANRPQRYVVRKVTTSYAARTMRWGGVILLLVVTYHILHFTLGQIGYAPGTFQPEDPNSGFQTYANVVNGFRVWPVSLF